MSSCNPNNVPERSKNFRTSDLAINWKIESVESENENIGSYIRMVLTNNGKESLTSKGWTIYFNQVGGLPGTEKSSDELIFERIAGDYNKLYPSSLFQEIKPGESRQFQLWYPDILPRISFAPKGIYIVKDGEEPELIDQLTISGFTSNSYSGINIPNAESRFNENAILSTLNKEKLSKIFPRPFEIIQDTGRFLIYENNLTISYEGRLKTAAELLQAKLADKFNGEISLDRRVVGDIHLGISAVRVNEKDKEAYKITMNDSNQKVRIIGSDGAGVFYGVNSLLQLAKVNSNHIQIPVIQVKDAPRYSYRGMHFDVARNFHSKEVVLKILDLMSLYKLNKFHFTLTNDEGWRLEIPGLPELTEIGAFRGHTEDESDHLYPSYGSGPFPDPAHSYGSGFYSRDEYIEILKYANDRNIEVIPELDLPGHARAAIKAMEARWNRYLREGDKESADEYVLHDPNDESEYNSAQNFNDNVVCVCSESTYRFTEKIVSEVVAMHKEAEVPLNMIHCGGDEVPYGAWQKSPVCEKFLSSQNEIQSSDKLHFYFVKRFNKILSKYGVATAGWEEIVLNTDEKGHNTTSINPTFVNEDIIPFVWNSVWGWGREDMAYKLANLGYQIVMSNSGNLYFDMANDTDPEEIGLSWSGYVDTKTTFSFAPENMFSTGAKDPIGNPLEPSYIAGKVTLTEKGKENILGIQGQLWSETVTSPDKVEYLVFPKILALAERSWSLEPSWTVSKEAALQQDLINSDWNEFANILGQVELKRLDSLYGGIRYRIPLPGAIIKDGMLHANIQYPGMTIRYSLDGSEPNAESIEYTGPVKIDALEVRLKTFASNGRFSRTSVLTVDPLKK